MGSSSGKTSAKAALRTSRKPRLQRSQLAAGTEVYYYLRPTTSARTARKLVTTPVKSTKRVPRGSSKLG